MLIFSAIKSTPSRPLTIDHLVIGTSDLARGSAWLERFLGVTLGDVGVPCDPSHANFVLARFATPDEAQACDGWLKTQGLIVRQVGGYKLPQCLRITVGDEAACRRVAHAVAQFKGQK